MSSEKTWSGQMRMREVLVVVVAATVFLLPYLLIYQRPSLDQLVEAVSQQLSSASTRWEPKAQAELPPPSPPPPPPPPENLEDVLKSAAMPDKTVIITTLNQAWAANNTMIDLFLESFHRGEDIEKLLQHLVVVALDQKSFDRCRELHHHCYMLVTEGVDFSGFKPYMSDDFLKMMWRRMEFMKEILEMGFNFVFSDADIVWFRNPFNHFVDDADFQISSDKFKGNPRSTVDNRPNCGYVFTRSNNHTIALYTHWCNGGKRYPKVDEQSQLGGMLQRGELKKLGVRVRFLPTELFSGFCEVSKDMRKVVTMHANCCTGLENKLADLRFSMEDWETGKDSPPKFRKVGNETITRSPWRAPSACKHSIWPNRGRKKNHTVSPTPTP